MEQTEGDSNSKNGSPRIGLALAAGAPEGAVYEIGALRAIDEALEGVDLNNLFLYVGVSAGAFLCANLANLLDRAPGRAVKASVVALVVAALAVARPAALSASAVVVGAALGLFLDDLHERLMLGDAGANVLGAVLGLGVVAACGPAARDVVLVSVAALNVAGELVSFTRVIESVPPLRALDRAGRRP